MTYNARTNVTLWCILAALIAMKNKYYTGLFLVRVCSLIYRAYNAHEPYCHLRNVSLYNMILRNLINGNILGKRKLFKQ